MPNADHPHASTSASSSPSLDLVRDELLAMDASALLTVNVDVAAAALAVAGSVADILAYRGAFAALCGAETAARVERLELLARAAMEAHVEVIAVESGADVPSLSLRAGRLREQLAAEVRSLVLRDVLPPGALAELTPGHGYRNQCVDLLLLAGIVRRSWSVIERKTGITLADAELAESLAHQLGKAVGKRDKAMRSPEVDLRQRAFTLLALTYDDARRMISFLRWREGDAERIAPSLYRGRGGRGRRREPPTSDVAPAPVAETDATEVGPPR